MRIVHLNTYDITGGAARATYRLHRGLRQLGHDSLMMVAYRKTEDPSVRAFVPPMDFATRLRRRIRAERIARSFGKYRSNRPAGYEKFTDDRSLSGGELLDQLPPCDVINLHWIADFVDLQSFFPIAPLDVPIFWRLSDMNAITGGCHFDHQCGRYMTGCGACPQLGSEDRDDLSRQVWRRKQDIFGRLDPRRLHIIALNRWMADVVKQSPLLGKFPLSIVPNGVDTDVFTPRDTRFARDVLAIPQDCRVVLFAADAVNNRRKGFAFLALALCGVPASSGLFLVSLGGGTPQLETDIPHLHLGKMDDERSLSLAYSAADVYVVPSLQDNQPNTVLEAMACGTPVIAFDVGGISEMVRPGVTGLLAPAKDVNRLRAAIGELLGCGQRRGALAAQCRRVIMEEYTREIQVQRYIELYRTAREEAMSGRSIASK